MTQDPTPKWTSQGGPFPHGAGPIVMVGPPPSAAVGPTYFEQAGARVGTMAGGKWHIDALVTSDATGATYAATHVETGARAALHTIHASALAQPDAAERCVQAAYASNEIEHPGVLQVGEDGRLDDGSPFVVTDLVEGETLAARWQRQGRRTSPEEATHIVGMLVEVLAAAHDRGIVHGDVSPENVFLTREGGARLIHFGLAWAHPPAPAFLAPERARGAIADPRGDVWSVGALLYTLLSGYLVQEAARGGTLPPVAVYAPQLPPQVCAATDRALAFDPGQRWPSARALHQAFATPPAGQTTPQPPAAGAWGPQSSAPPPAQYASVPPAPMPQQAPSVPAPAPKKKSRAPALLLGCGGVLIGFGALATIGGYFAVSRGLVDLPFEIPGLHDKPTVTTNTAAATTPTATTTSTTVATTTPNPSAAPTTSAAPSVAAPIASAAPSAHTKATTTPTLTPPAHTSSNTASTHHASAPGHHTTASTSTPQFDPHDSRQ